MYGFLLVFLSNFSPKRTVFEIFDFKNAVTLKTGLWVRQSHWNCHCSISAHMTSYRRSIVTMVLYRVVSEIFNVEKCRDLEIGSEVTQGHRKCYHSIDRVWFPISVV